MNRKLSFKFFKITLNFLKKTLHFSKKTLHFSKKTLHFLKITLHFSKETLRFLKITLHILKITLRFSKKLSGWEFSKAESLWVAICSTHQECSQEHVAPRDNQLSICLFPLWIFVESFRYKHLFSRMMWFVHHVCKTFRIVLFECTLIFHFQ